MKAIAIVALIFASLSIFVPVGGVFIAMFCSILALISFRSQTTLSGITFGLSILSTAFLSPSIVLTDITSEETSAGEIYWFYVGFHVVLLVLAVVWRLVRGAPTQVRSSNVQRSEPTIE